MDQAVSFLCALYPDARMLSLSEQSDPGDRGRLTRSVVITAMVLILLEEDLVGINNR